MTATLPAPPSIRYTLPKEERLCGKKDIDELISKGKFHDTGEGIRYCYRKNTGVELNRIMISVPKRNFKRAVKRNLLKRRIRESYRLQKGLLEGIGTDILFVYTSKTVLPSAKIYPIIGRILSRINKATKPQVNEQP